MWAAARRGAVPGACVPGLVRPTRAVHPAGGLARVRARPARGRTAPHTNSHTMQKKTQGRSRYIAYM